MAAEFCPQCRTPRTGAFRYCRSCGFDFETGELLARPAGPPSSPTAPPAAEPRSFSERYQGRTWGPPAEPAPTAETAQRPSRLPLMVGLILLLVAGAAVGALYLSGQSGGQPGGATKPEPTATIVVPPAGVIWFGTAFDTSTFEISGRLTSASAFQQIALVGHVSRTVSGSVTIRAVNGGAVQVSLAGEGDLVGLMTAPSQFVFATGSYRFEITDAGGNVLATGLLEVTE